MVRYPITKSPTTIGFELTRFRSMIDGQVTSQRRHSSKNFDLRAYVAVSWVLVRLGKGFIYHSAFVLMKRCVNSSVI